jgi:hypothetical protein
LGERPPGPDLDFIFITAIAIGIASRLAISSLITHHPVGTITG